MCLQRQLIYASLPDGKRRGVTLNIRSCLAKSNALDVQSCCLLVFPTPYCGAVFRIDVPTRILAGKMRGRQQFFPDILRLRRYPDMFLQQTPVIIGVTFHRTKQARLLPLTISAIGNGRILLAALGEQLSPPQIATPEQHRIPRCKVRHVHRLQCLPCSFRAGSIVGVGSCIGNIPSGCIGSAGYTKHHNSHNYAEPIYTLFLKHVLFSSRCNIHC